MNILIVKTSAIGDVVHTLPVLNALRAHFPEARIFWLVEEAAADVVMGHKAVDRVLVSKRKQWIAQWKNGRKREAIKNFLGFARDLRETRFDLLIDLQSLLKSGIFVFLARAQRKIGFGKGMEHAECSYIFLNERIPPVDMDQHAVVRELQLLRAIGIEAKEIAFDFPVDEHNRKEADSLLIGHGIDLKKDMVAINPMTTWPTKHWYGNRFRQVAERLIAGGTQVVFTGGPQDAFAIDEIKADVVAGNVNLAGKTSLKTLAALYERAKLLLTTDTGPMHVASAVGTPVVALFGPTAPWRTGPYGDRHHVLRTGIPCSPCLKRQCEFGTTACMDGISVEAVLETINKVLGKA